MRGVTNALPAGGGLRVIASGSNYPAREISLPQAATLILMADAVNLMSGTTYITYPGQIVKPVDGLTVSLSSNGKTITFEGTMPYVKFFALG